ncbi:MAG: AAA family ATPase [Ruminococcus sp.]|nr:AAA family ATPase [Ruminococcus sp.]
MSSIFDKIIFTGLNNLKVNTINTLDFQDCFGFTEDEVREMTEYYGISNRFPEMKEWYDGYLFGQKEIYNPWSIINFVSDARLDHNSLL